MRKLIYVLIVLLLLLSGYFLIQASLPKYVSYYPFIVVLILLDVYLWKSLQKEVLRQRSWIKISITALYWLPIALLFVLLVTSAFEPIRYWQAGIRTYSFGIVFIAYAAKLFTVIFLLIADIIWLFQHIIRFVKKKREKQTKAKHGNKISRSKFITNMGYIAGGVMFSGLLIGMIKWVSDFKVRRINIRIPRLPESFRGFKIVQFSDLHLGSWSSVEPMREAVDIINNLNPDVVFFTGDMVNFSSEEVLRFEKILKKIRARYGVYTILGNHDYGDYSSWKSKKEKQEDVNKLNSFYKRIGWKLLNNQHDVIHRNGEEIAVIGVENWGAHSRFPKHGDIQKALYGLGDRPVKLLLSHDPSHWEKVIRRKYPEIDVTFSGHTHGFQFGIETPAFKWSPAQYVYKQWAGLYKNNGNPQYIYVNRGTGFIGYPGRVGILPEITLVELENIQRMC